MQRNPENTESKAQNELASHPEREKHSYRPANSITKKSRDQRDLWEPVDSQNIAQIKIFAT